MRCVQKFSITCSCRRPPRGDLPTDSVHPTMHSCPAGHVQSGEIRWVAWGTHSYAKVWHGLGCVRALGHVTVESLSVPRGRITTIQSDVTELCQLKQDAYRRPQHRRHTKSLNRWRGDCAFCLLQHKNAVRSRYRGEVRQA